jgi:cyclic di-GMP phosphodiesterase Gmr
MKDVRELITLYSYVGTNNPYWRLSEDCNILHFSVEETSEADQTIELSPEQAERIREMTVITSSLLMTLPIEDDNIPVHLVGRKINKREWAGSASAWDDTPSVARDLAHGLSFAEQVVSEANSVIVILDRMGNIQRFNRLCEEYTGLKEREVIGQSVFTLFMSRREAAASRRNIEVFFAKVTHMKLNAG